MVQELQQRAPAFSRYITDFIAFIARNLFLELMERMPAGRNIIVFGPPLGPLPILYEPRSPAPGAYRLKIFNS